MLSFHIFYFKIRRTSLTINHLSHWSPCFCFLCLTCCNCMTYYGMSSKFYITEEQVWGHAAFFNLVCPIRNLIICLALFFFLSFCCIFLELEKPSFVSYFSLILSLLSLPACSTWGLPSIGELGLTQTILLADTVKDGTCKFTSNELAFNQWVTC